jgi:hypothetical protein
MKEMQQEILYRKQDGVTTGVKRYKLIPEVDDKGKQKLNPITGAELCTTAPNTEELAKYEKSDNWTRVHGSIKKQEDNLKKFLKEKKLDPKMSEAESEEVARALEAFRKREAAKAEKAKEKEAKKAAKEGAEN